MKATLSKTRYLVRFKNVPKDPALRAQLPELVGFGALASVLAYEDVAIYPYFPFQMWHDEEGLIAFWLDDAGDEGHE